MVALCYFHLLPLFLAGFGVFTCTDAYLLKYVPLVIGLREHYKTASVCIVMPYSNEYDKGNTLPFALTREFSRKGIFSFIINSEESLKRISKYDQSGVRPLVVVVLTVVEDINRFVINKKRYDILHPIWLVIFSDEFDASICHYCDKPTKNIFGLRFDTQMLIVCCKNKSLQEWWSDHRNGTETMAIGEWNVKDGLKSMTNQSLYARRSKVNGMGFRIGIVTGSAFYREKDGKPAGLFYAILMELACVMNFSVTRIFKEKDFGVWDSKRQSWSGVIELVDKNEIDVGVGEFGTSVNRLKVVDFTRPLMVASRLLYFKAVDSSAVHWSAHFKSFSLYIWITIIVLIITVPIIVTLLKKRTSGDSFRNLIFEHYLNVWGIFCQQGLAVFPVGTPLRIVYFSIFVSALVISAAYSACLISFITAATTTTAPFATLSDFANDGTYNVIVIKHRSDWDLFHTSTDPVIIKIKALLKPWDKLPRTIAEGFDDVCEGKVAFCLSEAMVISGMKQLPCEIQSIDMGSIDDYALILKAGSEYTGVINYHILRFEYSGILHRLKQNYLPEPSEPPTVYHDVTFWGVTTVFTVLAGGIVLSIMVMLGEKIYSKFHELERKWRISKRHMINFRNLKILRGLTNNKKNVTSDLQLSVKRKTKRLTVFPIENRFFP